MKAPGRNKHFWVRVNSGSDDGHVTGNGSGPTGDYRSAPDYNQYQTKGYSIGNRPFDTFELLIEHYTRHPIYTGDKGEKLYLIKPLGTD